MTATELLIDTMTKWGEHGEPTAVLLVYTDTAGNVTTRTRCTHTQGIGLAEYAKHYILDVILKQPDIET